MEQTRGYFRVEGKIWGLANKNPFTNGTGSMRSLSFGIQSSKENSNFVQVGQWANSPLSVKVKAEGMEETFEIPEQEAIDYIKEHFKDGDSVYLNCRAEVNTYKQGRLDYIVSQIYIKSEPIDFDTEDFEEVNELNQAVVITEKPENGRVKVGVTNYHGQMIEQELVLEDEDVREYFEENVRVGDLMKLSIYVHNKPIYEGEGEVTTRTTLKGKTVKSGGKKIKDRKLQLEVTDVDIQATEKSKYTRSEIIKALEDAEYTPQNSSTLNTEDDEDMMPY